MPDNSKTVLAMTFASLTNPALTSRPNEPAGHPQIYVGFTNRILKKKGRRLCDLEEEGAPTFPLPEPYLVLKTGNGSFKLNAWKGWKQANDELHAADDAYADFKRECREHFSSVEGHDALKQEMDETERLIKRAPEGTTARAALEGTQTELESRLEALRQAHPAPTDEHASHQIRQRRDRAWERVISLTQSYLVYAGLNGLAKNQAFVEAVLTGTIFLLELERQPSTTVAGTPVAGTHTDKMSECKIPLEIPEGFILSMLKKAPGTLHESKDRKFFLSWESSTKDPYGVGSLLVGEWIGEGQERSARAVILSSHDWHVTYADTRDCFVSMGMGNLLDRWP